MYIVDALFCFYVPGFGQKFGTTDSSHNSFARNTIGNTSNACHIPFMTNTVGTITSPSYFSQGSTFGGSSSGVFGASSSSSLASSPSFSKCLVIHVGVSPMLCLGFFVLF